MKTKISSPSTSTSNISRPLVDVGSLLKVKCFQENCNETAILECVDCGEVYCKLCSETLHNARGLRIHKVTPINASKCNIHKDYNLDVYCNTCDTYSCCYCIIKNHKGHDFCQLPNKNAEELSNLEELTTRAEDKLHQLINALMV
ncbi:hypothetical protein FQA39_LY13269 [Lamprigera yunnana]|nr:hypothetical protein FQA39_LY13269 [Lamprigera yunnana]